jgi:tRNA (mo5U34)-methyltransferase
MQLLNDREAADLVQQSRFVWHQCFHLSPKILTPGVNDIEWLWSQVGAPSSLEGLSVLDIGTTNGGGAFLAEARGAQRVVATDIVDPDHFGFAELHNALDSSVEFVRGSVYELPEILNEQFDVVLFLGVLYHLRHPLLGIDCVRRLTRGVLFLESAVTGTLTDPPSASFFRHDELNGDGSNWFLPTVSCLSDWVESGGFSVENVTSWGSESSSRASISARCTQGEPEFTRVSYEVPLVVRTPTHSDARLVVDLYATLLGREHPREDELRPLVDHLLAGGMLQDVIQAILRSAECQAGFFRNSSFRELVAPTALPNDVPRLYFWHVPKTAGSSLREMLKPHFPVHEQCVGLTLTELYRLSPARLRSFRFLSGHFGPALPQFLPDVHLITATLIRDPLLTVTSTYGQLRRLGPPGHLPSDLARLLPFDEWCHHEDARPYWSNPQARFLALERIVPSWPDTHESAEGEPKLVSDSQLESISIRVLEEIDVVGTTAELLDVYRECSHRLNFEPQYSRSLRINEGDIDLALSESASRWLTAHNSVDLALFERAASRGRELVT